MKNTVTELIDSVISERSLPTVFEEAELTEAQQQALLPRMAHNRVDCRQQAFMTIDDETAADFDDAVICRRLPNGTLLLSVAIADVAAYVSTKSALDAAAQVRGNSVYLPGRTLPMLPPVLSSGACSLLPGEDRSCVVCEMEIKDGDIRRYRFFRALIRSTARLTYNEAAAMMQSDSSRYPAMALFVELTEQLRAERRRRGAMMLELPEKLCVLEESPDTEAVKSVLRERNIAHWAIEEAMIAANRCAADFIIRHRGLALYRTHPTPPADNIKRLSAILATLNLPFPSSPVAADFAEVLVKVQKQDTVLAEAMVPLVLGALSRAEYRPDATIGHYGLRCQRYLHFTSPIRRYPDLLVHRAIIAILEGRESPLIGEDLSALGMHCTATEVNADKAYWECRQRLLCLLVQKFIDCEYTGIVSGLGRTGFFVSSQQLDVDGFVSFSSMLGYWRYDEARQYLVSNGETIAFGDRITVLLKSVNPAKGRINFIFLRKVA